MSTKPRIVVPQSIYQITSEGIRELKIFKKEALRKFFINQLSKITKKYGFECYGFSITQNQYYLVLKSSEESISIAMQDFNSVFAKKFNKIEKRHGTVFATRFKSILSEKDNLKDLIRFVHLQPVKAGECTIEMLDTFKWSGHSTLMGNTDHEFQNTKFVLDQFGRSDQVSQYRNYLRSDNISKESKKIIKHINDANSGKLSLHKREAWVLGRPEFIKQIFDLDSCRRARIARYIRENVSMEKMQEEVTRTLCLPNETIYFQGQLDVRSTARELFVFTGKLRFDFTCAQMAKHLGVSESAVSKMISRFKRVDNKQYLLDMVTTQLVIICPDFSRTIQL